MTQLQSHIYKIASCLPMLVDCVSWKMYSNSREISLTIMPSFSFVIQHKTHRCWVKKCFPGSWTPSREIVWFNPYGFAFGPNLLLSSWKQTNTVKGMTSWPPVPHQSLLLACAGVSGDWARHLSDWNSSCWAVTQTFQELIIHPLPPEFDTHFLIHQGPSLTGLDFAKHSRKVVCVVSNVFVYAVPRVIYTSIALFPHRPLQTACEITFQHTTTINNKCNSLYAKSRA